MSISKDDIKEAIAKLPVDDVKEVISDRLEAVAELELSAKAKKGLYLGDKDKGMLDAVQEKIISRKLLVFGAATALLIWAGLDSDIWGMIAMCYIGGQSAIDFAKVWKG
jgi:hypothetical protein